MPVSLPPLLAERLDITEQRAQSLLQTMQHELRRRAKTDAVHLPELGTFRQEGGTLTFEPSPSLRRRVNHQYEGLAPETLSVPDEPEAASLVAPGASVEEASTEKTSEAPSPSPSPSSAQEESPEEDTDPREEAEPAPAAEDRGVDSFTLIVVALIGIFLLGAGWFVLNETNVWAPGPSTSPPVASEQSAEPSPSQTPSDTTQQQADTVSATTDEEQPEEETASPPPKNWAIVVASRSSQAAAEEMADQYRSRFDSVEVIAGTVDNRTWYRVAIGWYESEKAAERALDDQASRLPTGAWTHRLR